MKTFVGPHMSLISGYGPSLDDALTAMGEGRSALRPQVWDGSYEPVEYYAQRVDDPPSADGLSRLEGMMAAALTDCAKGNKAGAGRRAGLIISTTKGNISEAGAEPPEAGSRVFLHTMGRRVARAAGLEVEPLIISNACISGVAAVVVASRLIRHGEYDDIFVLGADELSRFVASGFLSFRSVSRRPCLPFDLRRDGLSLGEAAGCILLTNNAGCGAEVAIEGGSLTDDANHISGPSRTGEPLSVAMRRAMGQSGRDGHGLAFVNPHGTGTAYNDEMEAKAIGLAGLGGAPVNSLKTYFGHTLGASGLIELMVCAKELTGGRLLPTLGYGQAGVSVPLRVSGEAQAVTGDYCLKTASGFGGCNAAVVVSKAAAAKDVEPQSGGEWRAARSVDMARGQLLIDGRAVLPEAERDFDTLAREAYHKLEAPNVKFFKMDDLCKMGYIGAEYLLRGINADEDALRDASVLLANRSASLDTDIQYVRSLEANEASPAKFVYTLPNIVIGEICIRHKIMGETLFVITPRRDMGGLKKLASEALDTSRSKLLICGWCEKLADEYELHLELLTKD